ncbi:zinc finger protein 615-like, partial [Ostrinia furnacalis]|uniref:zinc finger protein 615-like n=1 Tax=Ostrinia furnacalis TaxID=93504 RepID=UPI00103EDBF9
CFQVIGADGQIVSEKTTPGYACPECGSCFNTKEALSLHVRLHAGDRTCVTDLCALTAALQPGLVAAAQQATQTQPIQIISSNPSNVVHTQVIATNHHVAAPRPKIHFCVDCGKGFAAKHGLLAHQR